MMPATLVPGCFLTATRALISFFSFHLAVHPFIFLTFISHRGILINNVVLVSGVLQSDSVIHTYVSILFQIFFPI